MPNTQHRQLDDSETILPTDEIRHEADDTLAWRRVLPTTVGMTVAEFNAAASIECGPEYDAKYLFRRAI